MANTEQRPELLPFNDESFAVVVSPEEKAIGLDCLNVYNTKIKRRIHWLIKPDRITQLKPAPNPTDKHIPTPQEEKLLIEKEIDLDALAKEKISPQIVDVLETFKGVEDKLPDFMGRGTKAFRNNWGISRSYNQWGYEEGQHSDAIELILTTTGAKTQSEVNEDYLERLKQTWEMPFKTERQIACYATFQEKTTCLNYIAVAQRLNEEEAFTAAEIIKLVAGDEGYHHRGYKMFVDVFAKHDLEGTKRDLLHVAANFSMPANHLMKDKKKNMWNILKSKAMTREMITEDTLFTVLNSFDFVAEEEARKVADCYFSKKEG